MLSNREMTCIMINARSPLFVIVLMFNAFVMSLIAILIKVLCMITLLSVKIVQVLMNMYI